MPAKFNLPVKKELIILVIALVVVLAVASVALSVLSGNDLLSAGVNFDSKSALGEKIAESTGNTNPLKNIELNPFGES